MTGHSSFRIAIVDDDEQVRSALSRLLRSHGLDPTAFDSGEAFLDGVKEQDFDAALMDLHLPGLSGIEATRAAHGVLPGLPIIMMTGYPEVGTAEKCAEAGAAAFLTKPISAAALLSALPEPR